MPEVLHRHPRRLAVGAEAHVVDPHQTRVEQARPEQGLAAEATAFTGGHVGAHDLEGHVALEHAVVGLVDLAHPASADQAQDLVAAVADPGARLTHDPRAWSRGNVVTEPGEGRAGGLRLHPRRLQGAHPGAEKLDKM